MATETAMTIGYQLKLHVRVNPETGNPVYSNVNLGKMSLVGFNTDKAASLSLLLQAVLDKQTTGEYITRKFRVTG